MKGNSEAARLIDQGVTVLIGPFSSLVAFSVRQVTEKNKTPFMLLAAVADNLTEGGLKYVFRVQPNGKAMATVTMMNIVEMAKAANMPVKRVAMMHEDGNFGTTMGNHVEAFAGQLGELEQPVHDVTLRPRRQLRVREQPLLIARARAVEADA